MIIKMTAVEALKRRRPRNPYRVANPLAPNGELPPSSLIPTTKNIGEEVVAVGQGLIRDGYDVGVERVDGYGPKGSVHLLLHVVHPGHGERREVIVSRFSSQVVISRSSGESPDVSQRVHSPVEGPMPIYKVQQRFPSRARVSRHALHRELRAAVATAAPLSRGRENAPTGGTRTKLL